MQSRRVRAGIVLLLAVIALGAAGAAVDSTGGGSGSTGLGEGAASGMGGGEMPGVEFEDTPLNPLFPGGILATIIGLLAVGGMVAAVVAVVLALLNRDLERLLKLAQQAALYGVLAAVAVVALYFLFELFAFSDGGGSTGAFGGGAEGMSETASDTGVSIPPIVGAGIVVVVVLLLLVVARSSDDEEPAGPQVAPDPGEPAPRSGNVPRSVADVGRPPASNDVYRAWLSLARAAGADARSDTPEEVAERAVESGVDEEAAREITDLFESVRYGGIEPSDDLERRADSARSTVAGER